jgi:phage tail tape-measure protein
VGHNEGVAVGWYVGPVGNTVGIVVGTLVGKRVGLNVGDSTMLVNEESNKYPF